MLWVGIISQILQENLSLPTQNQNHGPLQFLSGYFYEVEFGRSTIEIT